MIALTQMGGANLTNNNQYTLPCFYAGIASRNFEIKEERTVVWIATIWIWLTSSSFGIVLLGAILLEILVLIVAFSNKNKDN